MSRSVVLFANCIFQPHKARVTQKIMDTLAIHFRDCKVYIGINPGTVQESRDVITRSSLDVTVTDVSSALYNTSDASAYQAALYTLSQQPERYEYYWFMHSKGGVNDSENRLDYYTQELLGRRKEVEAYLDAHPEVGCYGLHGIHQSADGVTQWCDYNIDHHFPICENRPVEPFIYNHVNWSYIETFYVIRGSVINAFLECVPKEFFTTKIENRWFFETVPPWLASRYGLLPYVKYKMGWFWNVDLGAITDNWVAHKQITI